LRVYHVAKETGLSCRALLQMLSSRGVDVASHMAPLAEGEWAVLHELVEAHRRGGPAAAAAAAARPAAGAARPGAAVAGARGAVGAAVPADKRRRPEDEVPARKPGVVKKKTRGRAADEKAEELSEELLEEGFEEVLEADPLALPGIPVPPPKPVEPVAPAPAPRPVPRAPVEAPPPDQRMSRLDQRRTPRTLQRQRRRMGRGAEPVRAPSGPIPVYLPVTVKEFSQTVGIKANDIIRRLIQNGVMANLNSNLEEETVMVMALEFNREVEIRRPRPAVEQVLEGLELDKQDEERRVPRPAVVAVLGHVDHGKTSLLDAIRKTTVAAGEAGGITQHIGAYQVHTEGGRLVTFLDTPGHEAFTAMRARGANVADVCVLVVAADDGVMPQTEEAISHARAAGVPIVVALNKMDKPQANRDRVLNQLSTLGLIWDQWGGDTIVQPVSATTGENVKQLVEMLALTADLGELTADPRRPAVGTVLEASKHDARGVQATLLVQAGTLRVGDTILAGAAWGRIRGMYDDKGDDIDEAPPSTPVRVTGISEAPDAGARFYVLPDVSAAKEIAETRARVDRASERAERPAVTLENVFAQSASGAKPEIRVILKADVKGSVEALEKKIGELGTDEVAVRVLHAAVGAVTESDIKLAMASRAIVVGFNVLTEGAARDLAERERIQVRAYRIIYEVVDDMRKGMEGLLAPEKKEEILGHATVKALFQFSKVGTIAGCVVTDGVLKRATPYRLFRDGKLLLPLAKLESLKRFKDDAREVKAGFECGLKVEGYDDVKVNDILECYEVIEVKRTLA
jgi:translation initiation factor IF-2